MLPSVSPVSAVDTSFTNAATRQDIAPAPTTPVTAQPTERPQAPNLASNTGIRAVSGELQLSNNVSVLAETLGKLLNIARMDGEAAAAYVNRLAENMKTLTPDQKANLEKALGSILRGISLDILARALKSSAGPEAARLAVLFELTRSGPAAPQTKPSVPAYLQDILPESPDISPIRTTGSVSASTGKISAQMPEPDIFIDAEAKPSQPGVKPSAPGQEADVDTATPATKPMPVAVALNTIAKTPTNTSLVQADLDVTTPLAQPTQASGKTGPTVSEQPVQTVATQPIKAAVQQVIPQQLARPVETMADTSHSTQLPAAPLNGQVSTVIAEAFLAASPKEMEKLLLAVILGAHPDSAEAPATQVASVPLAEPDLEHSARSQAPHAFNPQAKAEQTAEDALLASQRPELVAAQRTAVAHDIKAALLEQPTLHAAAAAMMAKEAAGLPYVAYPSAKDEQDSDSPPRGRWPSSQGDADDAEGDEGQPEQEAHQEERAAANDEPIDHSLSEGANDDGSIGNAESYYLRMSGFS